MESTPSIRITLRLKPRRVIFRARRYSPSSTNPCGAFELQLDDERMNLVRYLDPRCTVNLESYEYVPFSKKDDPPKHVLWFTVGGKIFTPTVDLAALSESDKQSIKDSMTALADWLRASNKMMAERKKYYASSSCLFRSRNKIMSKKRFIWLPISASATRRRPRQIPSGARGRPSRADRPRVPG